MSAEHDVDEHGVYEWVPVTCMVAEVIRSHAATDPTIALSGLDLFTQWSVTRDGAGQPIRWVPVLREWRYRGGDEFSGPDGSPDRHPCRHEVPRRHPAEERR